MGFELELHLEGKAKCGEKEVQSQKGFKDSWGKTPRLEGAWWQWEGSS